MTLAYVRTNPLRAAALGAFSLFFALFMAPVSAEASYLDTKDKGDSRFSFGLGNFSDKKENWWDPAVDDAHVTLDFNRVRPKTISGVVSMAGGLVYRVMDPTVVGSHVTVDYTFTLKEGSSLNVHGGRVSDGIYHGQNVILKGPDSKVVYTGSSLAIPHFANLPGGSYVLILSDDMPPTYTQFKYSLNTWDAAPNPGDVPLPGALVLLGSALVGAGALARKKTASGKTL